MTTPPNPREALRARAAGMLEHFLALCERELTARADQQELRELIAALAAQPPAVSVDDAMVLRALRAFRPFAPFSATSAPSDRMRAALTAALNPTQDAAHGGRDDG